MNRVYLSGYFIVASLVQPSVFNRKHVGVLDAGQLNIKTTILFFSKTNLAVFNISSDRHIVEEDSDFGSRVSNQHTFNGYFTFFLDCIFIVEGTNELWLRGCPRQS